MLIDRAMTKRHDKEAVERELGGLSWGRLGALSRRAAGAFRKRETPVAVALDGSRQGAGLARNFAL